MQAYVQACVPVIRSHDLKNSKKAEHTVRLFCRLFFEIHKFVDDFLTLGVIFVGFLGIVIDGFVAINHHILTVGRKINTVDLVAEQILEAAVGLDGLQHLVRRGVGLCQIKLIQLNSGVLGVLGVEASALLGTDQIGAHLAVGDALVLFERVDVAPGGKIGEQIVVCILISVSGFVGCLVAGRCDLRTAAACAYRCEHTKTKKKCYDFFHNSCPFTKTKGQHICVLPFIITYSFE